MKISVSELKNRIASAKKILESCTLCPKNCKANRLKGETGFCGATDKVRVWRYKLHHQEEPAISGTNGSGTIFFSYCSGRCLFCQNYQISQLNKGTDVTPRDLARMMVELQKLGAHNINLVSPTHYVPQILEALPIAFELGLTIPLLYNSNGYENIETLKLLDGVIDIYLPDAKYADDEAAQKLSGFKNYTQINRQALIEMFHQVGILECDEAGVAKHGLIIRHLVLPENLAQTEEVLKFIAENLSRDVHISLMDQYMPLFKAKDHPPLDRVLTSSEYEKACEALNLAGLYNGWVQQTHGEAPN